MKIKEEQKEVVRGIASKAVGKITSDIKLIEAKSIKRPVVIFLLTIAGIGIARDPYLVILGSFVGILIALGMATSAEDVKKLSETFKESSPESKAAPELKPGEEGK